MSDPCLALTPHQVACFVKRTHFYCHSPHCLLPSSNWGHSAYQPTVLPSFRTLLTSSVDAESMDSHCEVFDFIVSAAAVGIWGSAVRGGGSLSGGNRPTPRSHCQILSLSPPLSSRGAQLKDSLVTPRRRQRCICSGCLNWSPRCSSRSPAGGPSCTTRSCSRRVTLLAWLSTSCPRCGYWCRQGSWNFCCWLFCAHCGQCQF